MKLNTAFLLPFCLFTVLLSGQTFTQRITISCGDSAFISPLGYPTWNDPKILKRPLWGHAILQGDFVAANIMKYTSPPCFKGFDTVIVQCARATQITCDTGIYIFETPCANPLSEFSSHELDCKDSIYLNDLSAFSIPMIEEGPFHGTARIVLEPTDGAGVFYTPIAHFEGLDYVKVKLRSGIRKLYIFKTYCNLISKVDEVSWVEITLWPNPASSELQLTTIESVKEIQCYSLEGKKVETPFVIYEKKWVGDVSALASGMYTLLVQTKTQSYLKKFIKI